MILSIFTGLTGILLVMVIVSIVFAAIVGAAECFASIANWIVILKSRKARKVEISNGYTVGESARIFLDSNGMKDVEIVPCGFWRWLVFGNHYSPKKNVFFIKKSQMDKNKLSLVSKNIQKIAKAVNYREGDNSVKRAIKREIYVPLLPYMIIPIILVGVVVDALAYGFQNNALCTLIASCVGLVYFVVTAVFMFMSIKVEKKANEKAVEIMTSSNFLQEEELKLVKDIYKWSIIAYVADFILSIIRIIQLLFKILGSIFKLSAKK